MSVKKQQIRKDRSLVPGQGVLIKPKDGDER